MIKLYSYDLTRNKFDIKNKGASTLKRKLIKEKNSTCYICSEIFERGLELEHKIPVYLGGHLFDESNVDIVCIKCHQRKTVIDKAVIEILKKSNIIWSGSIGIISIFPLEELHSIYKKYYGMITLANQSHKIWFEGSNGKDYQIDIIESNRQEKK